MGRDRWEYLQYLGITYTKPLQSIVRHPLNAQSPLVRTCLALTPRGLSWDLHCRKWIFQRTHSIIIPCVLGVELQMWTVVCVSQHLAASETDDRAHRVIEVQLGFGFSRRRQQIKEGRGLLGQRQGEDCLRLCRLWRKSWVIVT